VAALRFLFTIATLLSRETAHYYGKHNQGWIMQLAVISDLHLGPGDASDSFGHDDRAFVSFLQHLETEFERIVLLGDIWEALTSPLPYDKRDGLRRAREAHPLIAQRLSRRKYTYIHGNHDLVAAEVDCAPSEWLHEADGLRLVFTHGHHHDWLIRRARWLSEWLVWLGAWSRRVGCAAIYRAGYWFDAWLSKSPERPTLDSFQSWALSFARQRSADVVIAGHTHVASSLERQGRLYLNSGSCSEGRLSYLAIDTKHERFHVCEAR
jgi:UDP-2,3-diacylglucosamine pyrophosphatase LpxH